MSAQADFWNNPDEAEKTMKQIQARKGWTSSFESLDTKIQDLDVLFEFFTAGEVSEEELKKDYLLSKDAVEELELKKMLSAEEDQLNAVLEINPGAGGTERTIGHPFSCACTSCGEKKMATRCVN